MRDKDTKLPDDTELARAFSLAERLMASGPADGAEPAPPRAPGWGTRAAAGLRYWLWRLGGRRQAKGDGARVAEHYERELARQGESLRAAGDKALARERARVAELEKLTAQLQQAYDGEMDKLRRQLAERNARPAAPGEVERALARAAEAEERATLAENKVEMLKEALEITRARAGSGGAPCAPSDDRFREAKRAFARSFHPDHGGRDDPERARMFLEFWPVLERIERGG